MKSKNSDHPGLFSFLFLFFPHLGRLDFRIPFKKITINIIFSVFPGNNGLYNNCRHCSKKQFGLSALERFLLHRNHQSWPSKDPCPIKLKKFINSSAIGTNIDLDTPEYQIGNIKLTFLVSYRLFCLCKNSIYPIHLLDIQKDML